MRLPVRSFGATGWELTTVGLGTWALGGGDWAFGWGPQDDAESIATIHHAVEAGINWLDTAPEYGLGHSEEIVGRALAGLSEADRPLVFTKCAMVWDPEDSTARHVPATAVGDAASLRAECEASLRRLGVDHIDLYQVHWPPTDGTALEDYWATLVDLRTAGKVRAIGLSNHTVDQLTRAEAVGHVDSLQPPLSAINRAAAADVIPWCEANDTGVIVYSPIHSGLLSGTFDPSRLALGDWRLGEADFTSELPANLGVAAAVADVAAARSTSAASVAIAWTLLWPGVTAAIVGARRPAQIDDWLDAADLQLTGDDLDAIAAAITRSGAGSGPSRPEGRSEATGESAPATAEVS
jgi:aryl-alcohol dehydrogenase-like predicted oxidoreductase